MKSKSFIAIVGCFILITTLIAGLVDDYLSLPPFTANFLNKIETIEEQEIKENLVSYQNGIRQEIEETKHRDALQRSYFSLGYIESLNENYDRSNEYYYKALSIKGDECDLFCGDIYRELTYNAFMQGNNQKANESFKIANNILIESKSTEELVNLYSRYVQALDHVQRYDSGYIKLLEEIKGHLNSPYQEIQILRLLAKSYSFSGDYDLSLDCLLDAYKVSVWNNYETLQRDIKIELGNVYYLNHQYDEAIELLYPSLFSWEDQDLKLYFGSLVKSMWRVKGYEVTCQFLNDHTDNIKKYTNGSEVWSQIWVAILQAELALLENLPDQATKYLDEAVFIYEEKLVEKYDDILLWLKKISLNIQQLNGTEDSVLIKEYGDLYEEVQKSNIHFIYKINLLDDIVNTTLSMGVYSLGYKSLDEKNSVLVNGINDNQIIDLQAIYQTTKEQMKTEAFTERFVIITMGCIIMITSGSVIFLIYNNKKTLGNLKSEAVARKNLDSWTDTLTKEALYEKLEHNKELTFIVVQYDDIKRYNEVYGYLNGDQIIKVLAYQIKLVFNQEPIARHSGNFFIIVSTDSKKDCVPKIKELIQRIYELNIINKLNLTHGRMTISAGVSHGKIMSKEDIDQQINLASHNLEVSRQRGQNTFTL